MKLTHNNVSYVKSGFRVAAGLSLIYGNIIVAGALIIVAEALGVLEEIV